MKYVVSLFGVVAVVLALVCFRGTEAEASEYLRIHIVANSNSSEDQNIKYVVKDAVVQFLIASLSEAECAEDALQIISSNLNKINEVAKSAAASEGASYGAYTTLQSENVPTRVYENMVLEEGEYLTLRIELGQAQGDNWWCVVFPAVCFLDTENPENFEYVSKIWEIIQSVIG